MKVSVILPTHAPHPGRLGRVIAALVAQTLPSEDWELLLVDNASPTPVAAPALPAGIRFRLIREERIGLSHARAAGIAAATGSWVVFVDDDNLLAPDYLAETCALFQAHPLLGALGGSIVPEFAAPPPRWTRPHLGKLALRDLGPDKFIVTSSPPVLDDYPWFAPYGAGLCMPLSAARAYLEWARREASPIPDRTGSSLGGCGDTELIFVGAIRRGLDVAYSSRLSLVHIIPPGRLRFRYLARLAYQGGRSWGEFLVKQKVRAPSPACKMHAKTLRALLVLAWRGRAGWISFLRSAGEAQGQIRRHVSDPR